MSWYKTGTVSVTQGSNAVIGAGTAFIRNSRVGDAFRGPDGGWYEVINIASDTALSISPNYQGGSIAAGGYSLAPMQGYVKDSADALRAATQVIASGVTDMQEQVAAATEAAESAGQSKTVATEQAGIAIDAAGLSTDNKEAAQLAAHQSQGSAQASGAAADRADEAKDASIQSEQAAADSAAAAQASAEHAEEVTLGKAASGDNNDITSLRALDEDGFDRLRLGLVPMEGATATVAGKKGLVPAPAAGDQDKFLTAGGVYKEAGGSGDNVGDIKPWKYSRATIPGGRLPHDGQIVTNGRTLYPEFWALIQPFCVTDAVWLAAPYDKRGLPSLGNGTTDFRMPDDNGKHPDGNTIAAMVLRGDGKNSAGTPGWHQQDQLQNITGKFSNGRRDNASFYPVTSGAFTADTTTTAGTVPEGTSGASVGATVIFDASLAARAGTETRSANSTVIWTSVVAKTAVNSGTVDVTVLSNAVAAQGALLATKSTLGVGQAYQDMTSSRAANTTYTNDTANPILVTISKGGSQAANGAVVVVDGYEVVNLTTVSANNPFIAFNFLVPTGKTYRFNTTGASTMTKWSELR